MSRVATSKLSSSAVKRNDWVGSQDEPFARVHRHASCACGADRRHGDLPKCGARASHQVGLSRYDVVTARRITSGGF
jgi:hypothetical protein